jgi:DNA polymerase-3 subunit alpha
LRTLCEKGLQERFQVITEQYEERLDYELNIIENMRFSDYFLIVWDFMNYAHEHGILTGPGRGSAAGSLVSYALRITNVDPIQHQLLFERFLNPERISMPDIDIDFPDNKRDQVIQYVAQKYGALHVAQIITFGTLAAKAAVRDVGRVMGFDQEALNKMSKAIPTKPGTTLKSALRDSRVLQDYLSENEARKQWYNIAMKIEGLPRHTSTHAAGVVISEKPLTQSVAVQEGHDDVYLTQYPMEALQDVGLLKM